MTVIKKIGSRKNIEVKNSLTDDERLILKKIFEKDIDNAWISLELSGILTSNPEFKEICCVKGFTCPSYYLTKDELIYGDYCLGVNCEAYGNCKGAICTVKVN